MFIYSHTLNTGHLKSLWRKDDDHSIWSLDIYVPFYAMWHRAYRPLTSSPWGRNGRYIHINATFLTLSLQQLLLNRPPSCFIVLTCIVRNPVLYSENAKYQRGVKDWRPKMKHATCHIRFLGLKFWSGSFSLLLSYEACIVAGSLTNMPIKRMDAWRRVQQTRSISGEAKAKLFTALSCSTCGIILGFALCDPFARYSFFVQPCALKKMLGFREEDHRPWEHEMLGSGLQNSGAPTHRLPQNWPRKREKWQEIEVTSQRLYVMHVHRQMPNINNIVYTYDHRPTVCNHAWIQL